MEGLNLNLVFLSLINLISILIAFSVYFTNRKEKINRLFLFLIICIIIWTDFNYIGDIVSQPDLALIFKKIYLALVSIFFIFAYLFSIYFPTVISRRRPLFEKAAIIILSLVSLLTISTDWIIKGVEKREWGFDIVPENGIYIFYFFVTLFIFLILFNLIKKYFILSFKDRLKLQYFLIGTILYALFQTTFNIIFPLIGGTKQYWQFGDYSAIFLLGFTAYAIVKHRLFEIRVVLTAILVSVIAILLALDMFVFTQELIMRLYKGLVLIIFLYFGRSLIRSVIKEIRYREEIEKAYEVEKKAKEELQRLDEAKNQFVMATQHHLRTPLTSMRGYVDLIMGGTYGKVSPPLKETIKKFEISTQRLIKIVNEFLDVSQFQLGKEVVHLQPGVGIEPILKEVVEELEFEAKSKGIVLKMEKPKGLPKITADPEKLKMALFNFIDNGIKYTSKGSVNVKVEKTDSKITITIKDTGIGMTQEEIKDLFHKVFERGLEAKKTNVLGRGIGMFIASHIISAHKGKVWAESEGKGKGSVFFIELPVG